MEMKEEALKAGADAFVSKGDSPKKLLEALEAVQFEVDEQQRDRLIST